tara:strand:- start:279 stop:974 length:696 start_codon:yes stop_codon:yes gene_type:complete
MESAESQYSPFLQVVDPQTQYLSTATPKFVFEHTEGDVHNGSDGEQKSLSWSLQTILLQKQGLSSPSFLHARALIPFALKIPFAEHWFKVRMHFLSPLVHIALPQSQSSLFIRPSLFSHKHGSVPWPHSLPRTQSPFPLSSIVQYRPLEASLELTHVISPHIHLPSFLFWPLVRIQVGFGCSEQTFLSKLQYFSPDPHVLRLHTHDPPVSTEPVPSVQGGTPLQTFSSADN